MRWRMARHRPLFFSVGQGLADSVRAWVTFSMRETRAMASSMNWTLKGCFCPSCRRRRSATGYGTAYDHQEGRCFGESVFRASQFLFGHPNASGNDSLGWFRSHGGLQRFHGSLTPFGEPRLVDALTTQNPTDPPRGERGHGRDDAKALLFRHILGRFRG